MKTQNEMIRWMMDYHLWRVNEKGIYDLMQDILGFGFKGFYNINRKEITAEYRKLRKEAKLLKYKPV